MKQSAGWLFRRLLQRLGIRSTSFESSFSDVVRQFHELYYNREHTTWNNTRWLGTKILKCPLDLWVYQEILFETRPDVIIESGTRHGGGALYLASLCDLLGHGHVISIDIEDNADRPLHPRIRYLKGSSTSNDIIAAIEPLIRGQSVMVTLDSDHRMGHVLDELRLYGNLVTKGHYLIVEDTNVNGHPVRFDFGPGPMEAVRQYLAETNIFLVDRERQKFLLTFNPDGFLRRIS